MSVPKFMEGKMIKGNGINVSKHDHPMHKGPHHDKYMGVGVSVGKSGSHEMGDKSHLGSVMGKPKGADVAGHKGKM